MSASLFVVQCFNGLQLGVLLFLVAAGLTLVFGVMDFINLAHGVQYMLGAYLAVAFYRLTGQLLRRRGAGAAGVAAVRAGAGGAGLSPPLRARPPGAGARHLRRHPVPQPGRETGLGCGAAQHADPRPSVGIGAADGWAALSRLSLRHHRRWAVGGGRPLSVRHLNPTWHAGARGRHQRANGLGARRRHQAAVHDRVRLRRHAGRLCRRNGGADPVGGARYG